MPLATELRVLPAMELTFPVGLPGFKGVRRCRLVPLGDRGQLNPFGRLVAVDQGDLGADALADAVRLVVAAPALLWPDLVVEIDDSTEALLEIDDPADVAVVVVVTLGTSIESSSANLFAPIVINTARHLATQMVPATLEECEGRSLHAPLPVTLS